MALRGHNRLADADNGRSYTRPESPRIAPNLMATGARWRELAPGRRRRIAL